MDSWIYESLKLKSLPLLSNKDNYHFDPKKKLSDKENKKRTELIKTRVNTILDSLIDNSEPGKMDN